MIIIFTDLDGTLLGDSSYSADPAREALARISQLKLPWVICSSKTRAEVLEWRKNLSNSHPFIVENGAALYVPENYFPMPFRAPASRGGDAYIEFGTPYGELVATLREASAESGCRVRGFHDMSVEDVSRACGLPPPLARLAKKREYDEPFEILDRSRTRRLLAAIEARGKKWTRGGRLYHITGGNDKADGVSLLLSHYRRVFDNVVSVGLGDGMNDLSFLRMMDVPVVIRSKDAPELKEQLQGARVTRSRGPAGWNSAVLEILDEIARRAQAR